jgi:ribosomal protein RSM22 (predicted rRNA methylase)
LRRTRLERERPGARLHRGLTGARELIGSRYLAEPQLRQAYEQDLAPRTRAAVQQVLARLPPLRPSRVLDLGAGTGAAGQAVRDRFGAVELVSVDQVAGPGVITADLSRGVRPRGVEGRFDLIVAAHLLNELGLTVPERARLVTGWCDELLADEGTCLIVEPALRETSRELLEVRDLLVGVGLFVVAPCLWQGPCPALARPRDWCHDAAPAVVAGRSRVDFSYLALRRLGQPADDQRLYRIVSDPLPEKGRLRLFGCGPAGRTAIVRLDRHRSEANAAFGQAERGQLISVDGAATAGDGLRVDGETTVAQVPAE